MEKLFILPYESKEQFLADQKALFRELLKENQKTTPPEPPQKIFKSKKQVIEELNISSVTLWKLTKNGTIKGLCKVGKKVMYDWKQVQESLNTKGAKS
jgi:predicted ester cyclase